LSIQSKTTRRNEGDSRKAVILLNFGGPQSLDDVKPFLKAVFSDKHIMGLSIRRLATRVFFSSILSQSKRKYELIGGSSPLVEITGRQSVSLERELSRRGFSIPVYAGMCYTAPRIGEVVHGTIANETDSLLAVPLYPHYSTSTTNPVFAELAKAIKKESARVEVRYIKSYEDHPGYIKALEEKLRAALDGARTGREEPVVIFSAHSLPRRLWKKDSLYISHIRTTARLVAGASGIGQYELGYQSGHWRWLGPTVEETLGKLAAEGCKSVVIVPLSFTCDNIETLYDIDIKLKAEADRLGVKLYRTESLNDSPLFISALADIAVEVLRGMGK
jgi:ferrochelatase